YTDIQSVETNQTARISLQIPIMSNSEQTLVEDKIKPVRPCLVRRAALNFPVFATELSVSAASVKGYLVPVFPSRKRFLQRKCDFFQKSDF
ncbi:MAG: hypothetical protein QGI70_17085, partial [Paracoccaceae bacterium]|nr:hypothetical protein [Paracoccaceae bacterium]